MKQREYTILVVTTETNMTETTEKGISLYLYLGYSVYDHTIKNAFTMYLKIDKEIVIAAQLLDFFNIGEKATK